MGAVAANTVRETVRGLYAITPDDVPVELLLSRLEALFADGLRLLQIRRKASDRAALEAETRQIVALAAPFGAAVIVNDDLELALACRAGGVHWGRDDAASDLAGLRDQITRAKSRATHTSAFLVGISCYDRFDRAEMAHAAGADYVAFGSFFPSPTKPHAVRADVSLLRQTRSCLDIPCVAIGGITRDNAPVLVNAGADAIAVISDLFASPNVDTAEVVARARHFHGLFANLPTQSASATH